MPSYLRKVLLNFKIYLRTHFPFSKCITEGTPDKRGGLRVMHISDQSNTPTHLFPYGDKETEQTRGVFSLSLTLTSSPLAKIQM